MPPAILPREVCARCIQPFTDGEPRVSDNGNVVHVIECPPIAPPPEMDEETPVQHLLKAL